jgi:5'-phosphate synthase pdxT subunit
MTITVGVLALQGAFLEHLVLLKRAAQYLQSQGITESFEFTEVRNVDQLAQCDALIIPGGESTTISLVAAQSGMLEPLREFVKYVNMYPAGPPPLTFSSQGRPQTDVGNMCWTDSLV